LSFFRGAQALVVLAVTMEGPHTPYLAVALYSTKLVRRRLMREEDDDHRHKHHHDHHHRHHHHKPF
jgi:hypothetical protein